MAFFIATALCIVGHAVLPGDISLGRRVVVAGIFYAAGAVAVAMKL